MNKPMVIEELSFNEILNRLKNSLKAKVPDIYSELNEVDPSILLLEVASYSEGLLRNRINNSLLAVMLDYATSTDLENLGKLYNIERKLIKAEDLTTTPPTPAIWEGDDELRSRIIEAPRGFSVAGPKSSYIYYGKLADAQVKDISALSPSPMEIEIYVLSYEELDGVSTGIATTELIAIVQKYLESEEIRPMGDHVVVKTAEIIEFSINLQIKFKEISVLDKASIIEQIKVNLEQYTKKEHKLGGFISLAGINACSFLENVVDVVINMPTTNIEATLKQAPYCSSIEVTEFGVEEHE